jgi:putative chitinase
MFVGMEEGILTGKKFSDFFNKAKEDWINARRIINGTDKAQLIAGHARKYYGAISYTSG